MGIRGLANDWFRSYLSNRLQYIKIQNIKSTYNTIECGSILGPILFLIYINDIHNCTSLYILCFADDTTSIYSSTSLQDLHEFMNTELAKLNDWFNSNKLCLNTNKSKHIILGPMPTNKHIDCGTLPIHTDTIDRIGHSTDTKSFKLLGLHID